MMTRTLRVLALVLTALLLAATPARGQASSTNIHTTLVKLADPVEYTLRNGFTESGERMWCVSGFTTAERAGYTLVTVTQVREDTASMAGARDMRLTPATCRDATTGRAMPTIHVHPDRACQPSPQDREAVAARMALFDGIVCGERAVIWYFAQDIVDVWLAQRARGNGQ